MGSDGCCSSGAVGGVFEGGGAAAVVGMREKEIVESGSWSSKVGDEGWIWRKRDEGEVRVGRWMA